jgi:hypothetical protein
MLPYLELQNFTNKNLRIGSWNINRCADSILITLFQPLYFSRFIYLLMQESLISPDVACHK